MLFFHNSYGTSEFPDCGNLVGADCMGNLRWANTEPSMHFRNTYTDPSVHFRKANTDLSMHFRKANTEFLLPVLLPTPNFTSKFTPSFIPNITSNLLHHDECNIISQYNISSKGKKPSGPAAPRVFGLWSGLGCGLGFAFRKSLWGPSIFSLGSTLSTLGKLPRGSIHHATSSAFPQIVPQ